MVKQCTDEHAALFVGAFWDLNKRFQVPETNKNTCELSDPPIFSVRLIFVPLGFGSKMKQEGQTAGFEAFVSTSQGKPF